MTHKQIVTRFHLFMLIVLAAIAGTAFYKIKAETGLPVHWGFDGKPDEIWPRNEALLVLPALGVLVTAIFATIGRLAPVEQVEPGRPIIEAALTGVLGLFCALEFALILIGIGSEIDMVRILAFALAAFCLILGLSLPQSRPNAYAGIRLPWTMKNPANWSATHRLTGVLMVIAAIGLALVAWLRPNPADMLAAMGAALFVPVIVGGIFSFFRARI